MPVLPTPPSTFPRPSVLVADDQPDVLEALRLLLKGEGFEVDTVTSAAGVLAALERRDYDALLMDMNYARDTTSGREGLDLLQRLKELEPDLPIAVMTAWGSVGGAVEAMRRGAQDYIEKPCPQATAQLAGDTNATAGNPDITTGGINQTTTDIILSGTISNVTSSIEIVPKIMQTLRSQMNVSLNDAITTALNAVGQNSSAISASAQTAGDFLVYRVLVLDADNNTYIVLVDPGNGDVLLNPQPLPPLDVLLNPQPLPPLDVLLNPQPLPPLV